jgi:glycerophosphoryl diester phosphodiesterase
MDKVEMIVLTKENKSEFTTKLKLALIEKFGENVPENYSTLHPWSLLSLIRDETIDTYQLLYVNDKFWTATGGMIREFNGNKIYQAVFRGFSNADNRHKGLGIKSYTHMHNTRYQIQRAKDLNCDSVIISFNDYNYKLFEVTQKYMLPKALPEYKFIASERPVMLNGVEQWLLTLSL